MEILTAQWFILGIYLSFETIFVASLQYLL